MSHKKPQPKEEALKQRDSLFEPLSEEQADKVAGGRRRANGRSR